MSEGLKISVQIGAFPGGQLKKYQFDPGATIKDGLEEAELQGTEGDLKVNGKPISSVNTPLLDGDQILVFARVRGNN